MAGQIKISTEQVEQIATEIAELNKQLTEELTTAKSTIEELLRTWEGEASQATIDAFRTFASKYFQNYEGVITNYVNFLKSNVAQGYFETEKQNVGLADSFK